MVNDEKFMKEALIEAQIAAENGEVPVGAVIVQDDTIIARAHNQVEADRSSASHAEMLAIDAAEQALNSKWLLDATMYVTLEPCSMCAGAIVLARIPRLVIGTMDPKTGACGSRLNIANNEDLNHRVEIKTGVLSDECATILKDFFKNKR